jgi:hypothetical protein
MKISLSSLSLLVVDSLAPLLLYCVLSIQTVLSSRDKESTRSHVSVPSPSLSREREGRALSLKGERESLRIPSSAPHVRPVIQIIFLEIYVSRET